MTLYSRPSAIGISFQKKMDEIKNLFSQRKFDDALVFIFELTEDFKSNKNIPKILFEIGTVYEDLGKYIEAIEIFRKVIEIKPDFADAHANLGVTLKSMGRLEEAKESYKKAIEIEPKNAGRYYNLAITLSDLGMHEEAIENYYRAIDLEPNFIEAKANLGILLFSKNQYEESIKFLKKNKHEISQTYLLRCYFMLDDRDSFFQQLNYLTERGRINATIGSLICRSEEKYGVKYQNTFARKPLDYVENINLKERHDFNNIFIKTIKDIINQKSLVYRKQNLLSKGQQSAGNFFLTKIKSIEKIEKIIREEIEKYQKKFKDSKEGFIQNWPKKFNLKGWIVNMRSGGELAPHMHENGWISGAVYINVPPKKQKDDGNFVVCLNENISKNRGKIINVLTGSLVLFPASLMHYTLPFVSDENRIVLAFDIIPK